MKNSICAVFISKLINYIASERKRGKRRENRFVTCRRCIQTTTFLYLCHESHCFVSCFPLFSSCLIAGVPRVISNADCVAWLYRQVRTRIFPWCGNRFSASTTCSFRQSTSFQDQDRHNRDGWPFYLSALLSACLYDAGRNSRSIEIRFGRLRETTRNNTPCRTAIPRSNNDTC